MGKLMKVLLVALLLAYPCHSWAICPEAATYNSGTSVYTTYDASHECVAQAVNLAIAAGNATVQMPDGANATWGGALQANSEFEPDTTGWSTTGSKWTWGAGNLTTSAYSYVGSPDSSSLISTFIPTAGVKYRVGLKVQNGGGYSIIRASMGGSNGTTTTSSGSSYSGYWSYITITPVNSTSPLTITVSSGSSGTTFLLEAVSVTIPQIDFGTANISLIGGRTTAGVPDYNGNVITWAGAWMDPVIQLGYGKSRVSGFTFINGRIQCLADGMQGFRIDHMKLWNDHTGAIEDHTKYLYEIYGASGYHNTGLIDHNILQGGFGIVEGSGIQSEMNSVWAQNPIASDASGAFAGADANGNPRKHIIYIEGNEYITSSAYAPFIDGSRGNRTVFRFNTGIQTSNDSTSTGGSGLVPYAHGLQDYKERGSQWQEWYNNEAKRTGTGTTNSYIFSHARAGSGIEFGNYSNDSHYSYRAALFDTDRMQPADGAAPTCNGQYSWDVGAVISNSDNFYGTGAKVSGTHDGSSGATVLSDSTTSAWKTGGNYPNGVLAYNPSGHNYDTSPLALVNVTQGSSCQIWGNTATTITCGHPLNYLFYKTAINSAGKLDHMNVDGLYPYNAGSRYSLGTGWSFYAGPAHSGFDSAAAVAAANYIDNTAASIAHNANGTGSVTYNNFTPVIGKTYIVFFDVGAISGYAYSGGATVSLGGVSNSFSAAGHYEFTVTASSNAVLTFSSPGNTDRFLVYFLHIDGTIDNGDQYEIRNAICRDSTGHGYDTELWHPGDSGKGVGLTPVYVWGNSVNSSGTTVPVGAWILDASVNSKYILFNRDIYADYRFVPTGSVTSPATDCTGGSGHTCNTGVGNGSLANRPSACVNGTGYFAHEAATPTVPGVLYQCQSGAWVQYWAPARCPHPEADPGLEYSCDYSKVGLSGYASSGVPADTTPPQFASASVNSSGTQLTININEAVLTPTTAGFTLTSSGGSPTLSYVSHSGAQIIYSIGTHTILYGETLSLSYTPGTITDLNSNVLASFSGQSVSNNVTAPTNKTLTVTKSGSGLGTIIGNGINCGGTCSYSYTSGTGATLNATPSAGSHFVKWTSGGDLCVDSADTTCGPTTMSADHTADAQFDIDITPFAVNVTTSGIGSVSFTNAGGGTGTQLTGSGSSASGNVVGGNQAYFTYGLLGTTYIYSCTGDVSCDCTATPGICQLGAITKASNIILGLRSIKTLTITPVNNTIALGSPSITCPGTVILNCTTSGGVCSDASIVAGSTIGCQTRCLYGSLTWTGLFDGQGATATSDILADAVSTATCQQTFFFPGHL